jgi:hypothetical protein
MAVRWRVLSAVVLASALTASAAAANPAGHSLAERFAQDSATEPAASPAAPSTTDRDRQMLERKLQQEERLRADEAEMLDRAKAEEEQRRAAERQAAEEAAAAQSAGEEAEAKRRAAQQAEADRMAAERAAAEKATIEKAETERAAAEKAAAESLAAQRQKAEEDEAADKAARERAARETARIKAAAERRQAAEKVEADRREIEAAKARIETAKHADDQRRMEAEREAEAKSLSEKLQRAREQRATKEVSKDLGHGYSGLGAAVPAEPPVTTQQARSESAVHRPSPPLDREPPARVSPAAHSADDESPRSRPRDTGADVGGDIGARATILLVMQPGTRGIRRHEKTGDPIVCSGSRCFVSEGAQAPARAMTRARAFGPGNTLGQRAGACRHSLVCIFRDVDLASETFDLQAVDMRILRHDRREQVTADVDHTCRNASGRLLCAEPVHAGSYRAWIVPERLAREVGPDALATAIADGLPPPSAARTWR